MLSQSEYPLESGVIDGSVAAVRLLILICEPLKSTYGEFPVYCPFGIENDLYVVPVYHSNVPV